MVRTSTVDKLATGGNRDMVVHYESIELKPDVHLSGDVILLVDDVTTTGNSLNVCREILMKNGASRVAMFAIGQVI